MKKATVTIFFFIVCIFNFLVASSQTRTVGTTYKGPGVFDGYTLINPFFTNNDNRTYLIDNCGDTVHSWPTTIQTGLVARLMKNGNLLRAGVAANSHINVAGGGGRVQIWDWNGSLVWDYLYSSPTFRQHHAVMDMPNGNILILSWDVKDSAECIAQGRDPVNLAGGEVWSEKIIEVQPIGLDSGAIVWAWDSWDHIIQHHDISKPNYGIKEDLRQNLVTG